MQAGDATTDQRDAILAAIRRGELTIPEAATLSGICRVTLWRWCKAAHIDAAAARKSRIGLIWWRIMSGRRIPKAAKRRWAAEALEEWNDKAAERDE